MYKVTFKEQEKTDYEKIQELCSKHDLTCTVVDSYYVFSVRYWFFGVKLFHMLNYGNNIIVYNEYHYFRHKQKLINTFFFEELGKILERDLVIYE